MHPGDTATIEVNMTNLSSTDWAVEVAITPKIQSPYGDQFARIEAYWEATPYQPGERVVVTARSTLTLTVKIYALDGAGTAQVSVLVHRVKPFTPIKSG
ncbi:MAG: hypothetical protein WAP23_02250 [Candidatus Spechtbacterales bacterium]